MSQELPESSLPPPSRGSRCVRKYEAVSFVFIVIVVVVVVVVVVGPSCPLALPLFFLCCFSLVFLSSLSFHLFFSGYLVICFVSFGMFQVYFLYSFVSGL